MKALDRQFATVFKVVLKKPKDNLKANEASEEFYRILKQVLNEDLLKTLERAYSEISRPTDEIEPKVEGTLELLRNLLERSLTESAAVVFLARIEPLGRLSLEQVLPVVPNAMCLDKWIKAAKFSPHELQAHLLDQPNKTYATAGANWLIKRPKPELAMPVIELFLARQPRPGYLESWDEVLRVALKKDKLGELLVSLVRFHLQDDDGIASLIEIIRSNRTLFKIIVDRLPMILARKESDISIVEFVSLLFDVSPLLEGNERKLVIAAMARLGADILMSDRATPNSEAVLAFISKAMRQIRNLTKGEAARSDIWVLEKVNDEEKPADGKLCVSLQGARYIALAFEKADQGFPVKDILTITARYLGLSPINKKGDTVLYDPLQHEDIEGGLVPGELVTILESGWAFNEEAVMRAKVKKTQGGSRV
jgi:hypothetical protein